MKLHPHEGFDNAAASYRHIEARPLAAAMGAEIRGVDVANLGDEAFAEVQHALFRHKMIFFRGQRVGHAEHRAFTRRFGPFAEDAYTAGVPGFPEVQPVIKHADDHSAMVFGSGWHTDSPFLAEPPAISTLRAVKVPPFGGDTMWANSALAWRMLSPAMQGLLGGLRIRFSMRDVLASAQQNVQLSDTPIGRLAATRELAELPAQLAAKVRGSTHPLLRTHPVSGEKSLYVDGAYAIGIEGLQETEAAPLLRFMVEHITQPAFTCRLRWEPGTLTLWDNRLCVHQAFNDYSGHEREMYRTTIAGEKPQVFAVVSQAVRVFDFNSAIVRLPGKSVVDGLRAIPGPAPQFEQLLAEHAAYVAALRRAGLRVTVLEALEQFPDSIFVEDPALVFAGAAVLLRPGAPSRLREAEALLPSLEARFPKVLRITRGYVDGGDILVTPKRTFIGLSARTDEEGAAGLQSLLASIGIASQVVRTPRGTLHLKSDCSLVDEQTLLATEALAGSGLFGGFNLITVPRDEPAAANAVRVNDLVLVNAQCQGTLDALEKHGLHVVPLPVTEIGRIDAGLSCMSLRWFDHGAIAA